MDFFKGIIEKLRSLLPKKSPSAPKRPRRTKPASPAEAPTEKAAPVKKEKTPGKVGIVFAKIWHVIKLICLWLYRLRGVLLSIPVGVAAVLLAQQNMERLPELVGFDLQATGEFAMMLDRNVAVMCPLALTGISIVLILCSKRVIYPWLISLFTLVVPYFLWITNIFPA